MSPRKRTKGEEATEKIDLNALVEEYSEMDLDELETEEALEELDERTAKLDLNDLDESEEAESAKKSQKKNTAAKVNKSRKKTPRKTAKTTTVSKTKEEPKALEAEVDSQQAVVTKLSSESKPTSTQKSAPVKTAAKAEIPLTPDAMKQSMDGMVQNWKSMKEATDSVGEHFEKVAKLMGDITQSYESTMKQVSKMQAQQNVRKPTVWNKVAVAVSIAAVVVSLISLSFSQAMRQSLLSPAAVAAAKEKTNMVDLPSKALARDDEDSEKKQRAKARTRSHRR